MAITEMGLRSLEDRSNIRDYGGMVVVGVTRIPTEILPEEPDEAVARANRPYCFTQYMGSLSTSGANSEY
jgi:hypothetical protein